MLAALSENWIFLFIVLVINNGNISCIRGILRDMLVGNRNGKAEWRIYKSKPYGSGSLCDIFFLT